MTEHRREKVIKGLELCRYDPDPGQELKYDHSCKKCPYNGDGAGKWCAMMYMDALALLKAQKSIVYCHECRFYNDTGCAKGFGWCERNGNGRGSVDEWYCADGERRKNDD